MGNRAKKLRVMGGACSLCFCFMVFCFEENLEVEFLEVCVKIVAFESTGAGIRLAHVRSGGFHGCS